jgi:hypothetical protein
LGIVLAFIAVEYGEFFKITFFYLANDGSTKAIQRLRKLIRSFRITLFKNVFDRISRKPFMPQSINACII